MKLNFRTAAIAAAAFVSAAVITLGFADKAEARRLYVGRGYALNAAYHRDTGLPWYAVRAYYFGGPWSGPYYSYTGWKDYAARAGIACVPGTIVKGGDGIWYNCQ